MTAHDRLRRVERVVEGRARGLRWSTIAAEHGISVRTAQRIYSEGCASHAGALDRDPIEIARELLDQHEVAIEDLALLAGSTSHDGARLGAIRSRLDAIASKAQLLMALGVLPHDLGDLGTVIEERQVIATIMAVLRKHNVSPEMLDDMARALARNGRGED